MRKQHGQTMVEFALVAPMIFLMIFGMIWGGFMFMEYLRFSNDLRAAVRDIALTEEKKRAALEIYYKKELENTYKEHLPKIYTPLINVKHDDTDSIITVTFTRRGDLPSVLVWIDFPPEKIPMLEYRMKLEGNATSDDENENEDEGDDDNNNSTDDENGNGGET